MIPFDFLLGEASNPKLGCRSFAVIVRTEHQGIDVESGSISTDSSIGTLGKDEAERLSDC